MLTTEYERRLHILMLGKLERIGKETIMVHFAVITWHSQRCPVKTTKFSARFGRTRTEVRTEYIPNSSPIGLSPSAQ
jgi:hypothetical protein